MKSDAEIWKTVELHFSRIAVLRGNARNKYLEQLHDTDPRLHDIVNELLNEEENLHPVFSRAPEEILSSWADEELAGTHIGIYLLERLIGEGAMASVFLARRDDGEFDQSVALKLIKPGILNNQTLRMFRIERQTLASLQHPHIARLYDGGVNQEGRPFFTMEYITGLPVTEYCKKHHAGLTERLQLFRQIAEAVGHAHNRLVAHLDLKPANILVDEKGQVKVLDFGIARIIANENEVGKNRETQSRFTLAYASPEQLMAENSDSASDIYTLGVILYELVVGEHPYAQNLNDPENLRKLILMGKYPPTGNHKGTLPSGIRQSGILWELEKIWQCALSRRREDRYASVSTFIQDIQAFLNKEPVSVIRRTGYYSTKKFFQRNKKIVTAISTALFAVLITILFYTLQVRNERDLAKREAIKAKEVTGLLSGIFRMADPNLANGDTITAVQLLAIGLHNLESSLQKQPEIKASLFHELTSIFTGLGRYELADSLAHEALMLTDSLYRGPHPEKARSYLELGRIESIYKNFDAAYDHLTKSLTIYKKVNSRDKKNILGVLQELSNIHYERGNYILADSLNRQIYDLHTDMPGITDEEIANDLQMIGSCQRKMGNYQMAEEYLKRSLNLKRRIYGFPHNEIAYTLNHLSSLKQDLGLYKEALPYARESFQQRNLIYGAEHIETIASQSNLARIYRSQGDIKMALPMYEDILGKLNRIFPKGHPFTGATLQSLAYLYMQTGKTVEAEKLFREAIGIDDKFLEKEDIHRSYAIIGLGKLLTGNGNLEEAKNLLEEAYRIRKNILPEGHILIGLSQQALGECLLAMKDYETALYFLNRSYESLVKMPAKYRKNLEDIVGELYSIHDKTGLPGDIERYQRFLAESSP